MEKPELQSKQSNHRLIYEPTLALQCQAEQFQAHYRVLLNTPLDLLVCVRYDLPYRLQRNMHLAHHNWLGYQQKCPATD